MYHKVGHPISRPEDAFLNISAKSFRRQMRTMAALGYQALTFAEVTEAMTQRRTLPRRTFAITFDDGYRCIGEVAAPILAEFGFPATVFVVSSCVGATNRWDRNFGKPELPLLNWKELNGLVDRGWEVGGHTRSHLHLGALDDAEAYREISEGKQEVEAHTRQTLRTFCYPFGGLNERTPELVRAAGFCGACTTRSGLARSHRNPFLQPRVKVHDDGVGELLFRLLIRPYLPQSSHGSY
jgi:peptidoglycan/xylan/chitin deacetylase (PgdA/CDA1 family)